MKLFSKILLLSCLAKVAMGAVNLRAEKSEELSQRIVKDAKAKSVELGAQLNAAKGAATSVRNLLTTKAEENEDGWLGLAIEVRRAESLQDFAAAGGVAAEHVEAIAAATETASSALNAVTSMASSAVDKARHLWAFDEDFFFYLIELLWEVAYTRVRR